MSHHRQKGNSVTYRRDVTQTVLLTAKDLSQDPPHDLATSRLRQVVNNEDSLGRGERSNGLADLQNQVLAQLLAGIMPRLEGHERVHGLTREFIGNADHGGFGNSRCKRVSREGVSRSGKNGALPCSKRAASISAVDRR